MHLVSFLRVLRGSIVVSVCHVSVYYRDAIDKSI